MFRKSKIKRDFDIIDRLIWIFRKDCNAIRILLIMIAFFASSNLFSQTIRYESDAQGNLKGIYIAPDPTKTFPVSGSMTITGGATETTQLLIKGLLQVLSDKTATETQVANILTQLLKLKFDGDNLKTVFSNTTIGATQSGVWNIGSITTLPNVTIGSMPAVTATDLDIRDLSSAIDSVKVEGGNTTAVKVDGSAVTQPISAVSLPLPTGAALETGGNLALTKTAVEAINTALQTGGVTQLQLADIITGIASINSRLDDMTHSETDQWERFIVNPYTETVKTYTNVNKISVIVETADKAIRVSANNYDTTTDYAVIRSDSLGWTNGGLRYPSYQLKLLEDSGTESPVVCVHVEKYIP